MKTILATIKPQTFMKSPRVSLVSLFCLCVFAFSFYSCEYLEDDLPQVITSEVMGKYLYKYSSGQVEALFMNNDSTYEQLIYKNEKSYLSHAAPMLRNTNKWSVIEKGIRFEEWLMCSDSGLNFDTTAYKTRLLGYSDVSWRKPKNQRTHYKLYFYHENGYVFTKQTDTMPVYHVHNTL